MCVIGLDMTTPPWWREKVMVYYYYSNDSVLNKPRTPCQAPLLNISESDCISYRWLLRKLRRISFAIVEEYLLTCLPFYHGQVSFICVLNSCVTVTLVYSHRALASDENLSCVGFWCWKEDPSRTQTPHRTNYLVMPRLCT